MSNTYILYHAHCTDGTGSKFAAWKKFGTNAKYIAVNYGNPVPEMEPGSELYIVDFSYPKEVLEQLQSVHKSVIVLDHHKTAEEALRGVKGCTFDMNKSGCVLTWEHFHPDMSVPHLLLDIQDRDLWLFKRPNSKYIHAALQLTKGNMEQWNSGAHDPNYYDFMVNQGRTLLQRQDIAVDSAVKHKTIVVDFMGFKCGITNTSDLASEIGSGICAHTYNGVKPDFAMPYCINTDGSVLCSMRSLGEFDVSALAAKLGGGGHRNAAGCRITLEMLTKIIKGRG